MSHDSRGPWFWILGGCGCLVLVVIVGLGVMVWTGSRMINSVAAQLEDPELRRTAAERVLGPRGIPPGYQAKVGVRIPLVGELVVLEESNGADDQASGEGRSFVFMSSRMLDLGDGPEIDTQQFEEILEQQGFRYDRAERLGDGRLSLPTFEARWIGYRGQFDAGHGRRPVVMSMIAIDCPRDDGRGRLGLWLEPNAEPSVIAESVGADVAEGTAGSVVDPDRLSTFLRQMEPCPSGG